MCVLYINFISSSIHPTTATLLIPIQPQNIQKKIAPFSWNRKKSHSSSDMYQDGLVLSNRRIFLFQILDIIFSSFSLYVHISVCLCYIYTSTSSLCWMNIDYPYIQNFKKTLVKAATLLPSLLVIHHHSYTTVLSI